MKTISTIATLLLLSAGPLFAQAPVLPRIVNAPSQPAPPPAPIAIVLDGGTGRVVQLPAGAATVIAADPHIARVQALSPTSLFLMGVGGGRTSVVATSENGSVIAELAVTVRPQHTAGDAAAAAAPAPSAPPEPTLDVAAMQAAIRQAVPDGTQLTAIVTGDAIRLTGTVRTALDAQRTVALVHAFAGEKRSILNDLQVLGSIQVNVRVRIAEISRQVTRDLGFNWQAIGNGSNFLLGFTTGASAGTAVSALTGAAGTSRAAVGFNNKSLDLNAVVDALASDQLITILAEPNLTAQSGETASFLSGGEFPIPVAATTNNQITISFKQFGVSLAFTPTVLSDTMVNLRVRPEVSELSNNGAISLPISGGVITVPALNVRRAETTVEVGSGQSFAIAGLLQRNTTQTGSGIDGLGDVPVLGALFRSDAFQHNESELVIIVTPYIVHPLSGSAELAAPTDGFRPAIDLDRILYQRQVAQGGARNAAPTAKVALNAGFILD